MSGRLATLHPVHRLDGGTSGAVVFAYNAHVQHTLQRALHTGAFAREYVAYCEGEPGGSGAACAFDNPALVCEDGEGDEFVVDAPIARISYGPNVFAAVSPDDPAGKPARTHFVVERTFAVDTPSGPRTVSRLRLRLETGRTHQIRIHLALIGHALIGDDTYGHGAFVYLAGEESVLARPALHSARVSLVHPMTEERLTLNAPLPEDLRHLEAATL